jgi:hypothetical protein
MFASESSMACTPYRRITAKPIDFLGMTPRLRLLLRKLSTAYSI